MKFFVNKYVSMILVAVMAITMLANPMTYLKFKLNQEYIAKTLCVNKSKPQLKCNGHCYLVKQLKKAQQDQQSTKKVLEQINGFNLFCANIDLQIPPINVSSFTVVNQSRKINFSLQEYFSKIPQPPKA